MSKKRSKAAHGEVEQDRLALIEAGYHVQSKSPYHWHVTKVNSRVLVNVWPTAKKLMRAYGSGAHRYDDVVKSVSDIFDNTEQVFKPTRLKFKRVVPPTPDTIAATEKMMALRNGGIEYLRSLASH